MSEQESEITPKQPPIPSTDRAKKISPIKMMKPGEDSFDSENTVIFSDFRPQVLPADVPDAVPTVPKDVYAPGPAPSTDLAPASGQSSSGTSVPKTATSDDGKPNPSATSSQPSSSGKKTG